MPKTTAVLVAVLGVAALAAVVVLTLSGHGQMATEVGIAAVVLAVIAIMSTS